MIKPFFKKNEVESDIQGQGREFAIKRGWFCCKLESPTFNGFPDYFFLRRGITVHVEWKTPDGSLRPQQIKRIRELREHGGTVHVFDNIDDFRLVMK